MIFINEQWQGCGVKDRLVYGINTFREYFKESEQREVPVSDEGIETVDNVIGLKPLVHQLGLFHQMVEESRPEKISMVAGDCGAEIIPVSYLNKLYSGDMALLWIDAHADLNTPESSPSKTFHGMPLRILLGEGHPALKALLFSQIKVSQVCYFGLRELDEPEREFIERNQMVAVSESQMEALKAAMGNFKNVYIHLDLDVFDPTEFPHTMFPTPGGPSVARVWHVIDEVRRNHNVVGFCITESTASDVSQLEPIKHILAKLEL